jgi:hypothetical protein
LSQSFFGWYPARLRVPMGGQFRASPITSWCPPAIFE